MTPRIWLQCAEVARVAIRFYSLHGDLVLDPYAGGGTTGRVALEEGRSAVLIEREEYFCSLIREALSARPLQPELLRPRALQGGRRFHVPGTQLRLGLGGPVTATLKDAFADGSRKGVITERFRSMAREASRIAGVDVPPELVAILLRAERLHYAKMHCA